MDARFGAAFSPMAAWDIAQGSIAAACKGLEAAQSSAYSRRRPSELRLIFFSRHLAMAIAGDARFGAAFYKAAMAAWASAQGLQLLVAGVCRGLEAVPSSTKVNTTSTTIARNNTMMASDDGVDRRCAPKAKGI